MSDEVGGRQEMEVALGCGMEVCGRGTLQSLSAVCLLWQAGANPAEGHHESTLCVCVHMHAHAHMSLHMYVKVKGQFVKTGSLAVVEFSN